MEIERRKINLNSLVRIDKHITEIIHTISHAVAYDFDEAKQNWVLYPLNETE